MRYVNEYRDRHGAVRRYFRRPGSRGIPLPGRPGSPEFMAAYNAALAGITIERAIARPPASTIAGAIVAYYSHGSFAALAPGTQKTRRAILERFRSEHGDKPIAPLQRQHFAMILGNRKPFAARNWLKALRGLMQFAVAIGLRADDPTQGIKPVKAKAGTIHTWTEDEIEIYERHHALGGRPRLAMAILLYTAARRGDAITFGPQHLRAGRIFYRQQKTGRSLSIPVHPAFAAAIEAAPSGHLTFLVTGQGKPFTAAGFGNLFREWCDEAGLPQCSAHGLRKAQARRLAEAGCSAHEIASITGHRTLAEVQRYADAADQARLAEAAMQRTNPKPNLLQSPTGLTNRDAKH